MSSWNYVLDEAVFHFFLSQSAAERRRLVAAFDELRGNPNRDGDYFVKDAAGRTLTVYACRPFLITYWLDAFVSEVRIVDVQRIQF